MNRDAPGSSGENDGADEEVRNPVTEQPTAHPTGNRQADENAENEPPA